MMLRRLSLLLPLGLVLLAYPAGASAADPQPFSQADAPGALLYLIAWFLPLGVALATVGLPTVGLPTVGLADGQRAHDMVTALPLALVAALLGYTLLGHGLLYGASSAGEWTPLLGILGPGWGLAGRGALWWRPDPAQPADQALFFWQLVLVVTAAAIPLSTLHGRIAGRLGFVLALLVAGVTWPLVGNWSHGGGWLGDLGTTLSLGQGFVDQGWSAAYLVGAAATLAGLLAMRWHGHAAAPNATPALPPTYLPLNLLTGALFAWIGWGALLLSQPQGAQGWSALLLNGVWGLAGGVVGTMSYAWLAQGRPDAGLTGRGLLAALVALSAGIGLFQPWQAGLVGLIVGLAVAPSLYVVERLLRLPDAGAALSVHGLPAILGLLAAGLVAADGSGDGALLAQLVGLGAILLIGFVVPWAVLSLLARAYALPATVRDQARERARAAQEHSALRRKLVLQGLHPTLWQRVRRWALALEAAPARRLRRRLRLWR